MAEIGVEIELDKGLKRLLAEGNEDLERELWRALLDSGQLVKGAVQNRIEVGATRLLRGSVFFEPRRGAEEMTGVVGTPSAYALPVEDGARPHMPPVEPLVLWVRRKFGITDDDQAVSVAWAVARTIKKRGTKRYQTKEPGAFAWAFKEKDEAVQRRFDQAVAGFIGA